MWPRTMLLAACLAAGVGAGAEERPAQSFETLLRLRATVASPTLTAGQNLEILAVLANGSDKEVTVSPLQPHAFVTLRVEDDGKVLPSHVKASLVHWPDVTLRPGQQVQQGLDLCTWFPLGLYEGSFRVRVVCFPDRLDRRRAIESGEIEIRVNGRTAEQEKAYQDFVAILRARREDAIANGYDFLQQHPGSMFQPRVRLHLAAVMGEGDTETLLGEAFERASPTPAERVAARYYRARALRERGKLEQAISLLESVPEPWAVSEVATMRHLIEAKRQE